MLSGLGRSVGGSASLVSRCSARSPAARPTPTVMSTCCTSLPPGIRLGWDIEELSSELAAAFGRPVDLVARNALHVGLRDVVTSEARSLYAA